MRNFFQEVQVDKVSDKIVEQLEVLIQDGRLALGDKLPSERELMKILGVGRSSLREALNKLETMGYVEIKKRKGVFVKSLNSMLSLDPLKKMMEEDSTKLVQLFEVRSDIEQANAYRAALARNEDDLRDLRDRLDDFGTAETGFNFSWRLDLTFHSTIARATHNFFRIHVLMSIDDFSKEFFQPIIEAKNWTHEQLANIIGEHWSIYQAIADQNPDAARKAVRDHLDASRNELLSGF